jgi:hypothetical protein
MGWCCWRGSIRLAQDVQELRQDGGYGCASGKRTRGENSQDWYLAVDRRGKECCSRRRRTWQKKRRTVADFQERVVHHLVPKTELVLDRAREMKVKFHLGSLPLGWAWFIPAFHLPEPIPPTTRTHTLRFPRSQIDFPLGPGQAVEEIVIKLEEIPMTDAASPAPLLSDQAEKEEGLDDRRGEGSPLDKVE